MIQSSGSRCGRSSDQGQITLLAPEDHIATTVSGRPTFFWYIAKTREPDFVRFTLVVPNQVEPVIDTQMRINKSGLFKFTLPPNVPELQRGKLYRWTVSLIRNKKHPSQNIYAYTAIKRIALPNKLKQKLPIVNSQFERSALYATSGIWYDTLATIYRVSDDEKSVEPQTVLERINSGNFMWLINQLTVASYVNVPEDLVEAKGSACGGTI